MFARKHHEYDVILRDPALSSRFDYRNACLDGRRLSRMDGPWPCEWPCGFYQSELLARRLHCGRTTVDVYTHTYKAVAGFFIHVENERSEIEVDEGRRQGDISWPHIVGHRVHTETQEATRYAEPRVWGLVGYGQPACTTISRFASCADPGGGCRLELNQRGMGRASLSPV